MEVLAHLRSRGAECDLCTACYIGDIARVRELLDWGWIPSDIPLPKMIVAQSEGCAPIVKAWQAGADRAEPWPDPATHAAGLRVPGPLGDRLILRASVEGRTACQPFDLLGQFLVVVAAGTRTENSTATTPLGRADRALARAARTLLPPRLLVTT